jgi:hypothetical protein
LRSPSRFLYAVACAAIAFWFLWFAGGGLFAALSGDDLMNLHGYVLQPASSVALQMVQFWSTAYRPLGALFYLPMYHFFGLNPLPYRIGCFVLLGINLFLLYRFCARVSGSVETAVLATFIASYHAWFVDLYYSAGTIYDLACYPLYLSAFLLYIRVRDSGRAFGWAALAGLVALYILALDAKEMAATLPLMMLVWEVVHRPGDLRNPLRWITRDARGLWATTAVTIIYAVGKLTGKGSLVENPAYALHISAGRYLDTFHLYMNPLFYQDHRFHDSNTIQILLAMLAFALWRRADVLLFAWSWLLLTILPVSFIPHYAAFFEYLPAVGWVLYIATVLVMARHALMRMLPRGPIPRLISQSALFLATAAFLAPQHTREAPRTLAHFMKAEPPTRELAQDLARLKPHMPHGARILSIDDPFPPDTYDLLFETRLFYRDMTIEVERVRTPQIVNTAGYDAVLRFQGGRLRASPE